ncbi:MAG TPA: chorismate mutase [Bdellovibrio sp.]|nr:chorismate mutase [Bdellovibrio sp.]
MSSVNLLRQEMNTLSKDLVQLLLMRKELSAKIIQEKGIIGLEAKDPHRETELMNLLTKNLKDEDKVFIEAVFAKLFELSRGS